MYWNMEHSERETKQNRDLNENIDEILLLYLRITPLTITHYSDDVRNALKFKS